MSHVYGEEIKYECDLLKPEDYDALQAFSCGNVRLDSYIHKDLISHGYVDTEDGLPFKVWNVENGKIISVFSLAASGIIYKIDNYTKVLPAIKIDIFAVDINYQKMHMDKESELAEDRNDHVYLSDSIMCSETIKRCRDISEKYAAAKYIVLYADKKARRFYERNLFSDFIEFMEKEKNMEICENDPMYMELD